MQGTINKVLGKQNIIYQFKQYFSLFKKKWSLLTLLIVRLQM